MSCYHPFRAMRIGYNGEGKQVLKIVPYDTLDVYDNQGKEYDWFPLPCGHCIGCRQDQSKEWSNRLLLESQYHDRAYFITLTYDNLHAHNVFRTDLNTGEAREGTNLEKRDCQLFFKRLRFAFPDARIRYYIVGEYGPETLRAHYHGIIFGVDLDPYMVMSGRSETGNPYYTCEPISEAWDNRGFVSVEPANYYTFKYVASYVTTKVGKHPNDYWKAQGLEPPFALMSRKPGIGYQYLIDHPELRADDTIVISTDKGAVEFMPPRYFRKKYKDEHPEEAEEISKRHIKAQKDRIEAELSGTDLEYLDYLKIKENNHYAKLKNRDKIK